MKVLAVGIGDCGCRLANEFSQLNKRAKAERRGTIVTRAYAVNNDRNALALLAKESPQWLQSVFIGSSTVGEEKATESGAELLRREGDRVISTMKPGDFFETDAFLFIAGAAGNLGSGGVPIMAQKLKDRYVGKPVYALIILPFDSELSDPQRIYTTAICLKSIDKVADAVFLADNEKFRVGGSTKIGNELNIVNKEIVSPFYDLLCASEAVIAGYGSGRTLGTGDLVQTLSGWTAIGTGSTKFPVWNAPWKKPHNFQAKGSETLTAMEAMSLALGHLSIDCKLEDADKALYLISVPAKEANIDMAKALGNRLRELIPKGEIRGGDFYGVKDSAQVSVVISKLTYVEKIKNFYDRAISLADTLKKEEKTG